MVKEIPLEALVKIFRNIKERDARQCLLVNKLWSRAARLFIGQSIDLTLTEKSTLYQDLLQFPLLARRVTGLTINSNDTLYCIMTLSLCPNLLDLSFYKCRPAKLLDRLTESEFPLLPKIQSIWAGPGNYNETSILWPCIWKHRTTITRISTYGHTYIREHAKDIPEFISHFPQLEVFSALGFEDNLHKILSSGKNLRKISLSKAFTYYDNEENPEASLPTKLEEFSVFGSVHISVLRFLAGISNSSSSFQMPDGSITVREDEDIDELLEDIIEDFPDIKSKIARTKYPSSRDFVWKKN